MPDPDNPLFINTILLGGSTHEKIMAAADAGFDQVELWQQDVDDQAGGATEVETTLRSAAIGLTDFQALMDFDGAPGARRIEKRSEALGMLNTAVKLGATTVLVPASTDPDCDANRVVDDLRWLCMEANQRALRIAYEGMAWSTLNHTTPRAWQTVRRVDMPNLGMVIDLFHIFVRGGTARDLDGIPMERIYLVQLSDLDGPLPLLGDIKQVARHRRQLPGNGNFPISTIVARLKAERYAGPVGLEIFNDALKAGAPADVAQKAMAALRRAWVA